MSSERQSFEFSAFFGAVPLLRLILSSIGVTGVLVGIGYIVAYSREHLLGIDITRAATTADYAALGARFFVDVIVTSYKHFAANIKLLVLVLIAMIAVVIVSRRVVILPPLKYRSFLMLAVLLLLVCKLVYYDIPFVLHSNVLFARTDYSKSFDLDRPLNGRAATLWKYFADRHDIHGQGDVAQRGEMNLEAVFLEDVALTWLLTYAALIALRKTPRSGSPSQVEAEAVRPMRGAFLTLTSIALVMSIASVPFTYGKAMWDARLPYVIGRLRPPAPVAHPPKADQPSKPIGAAGDAETVADPAEVSDDGSPRGLVGLLLAVDEKTVLLYSTRPDENMMFEYSRNDIEVIRFPMTKDLIGEHIAFTNRADGGT